MLGSARSVLVQPPLPAALGAYNFSEGSGATSADVSGNGHTLTLHTTSWTTGHAGPGITNSTTNAGASADFTAAVYSSISLMGWIKPLDLTSSTTRAAIGIFDSSGNTSVALFVQRSDFGTPDVVQANFRIAGVLREVHGSALTLDTWTHVALTYDGSVGRLYVDGSLVATSSAYDSPIYIYTNSKFVVAGGFADGEYDSFVTVDDVRAYKTALSHGQIVYAMNTPV